MKNIANIKEIRNSDQAVVGIIVAILLIGLLLTVITIIQTVFVPNWMENIEADHMDEISAQFDQLKFAIDIQSALNISDIPISVPITLGSNNLPILQSVRAYGLLEIMENEINIDFTNSSETNQNSLGIIKYTSTNSYYLNQEYIYESGSLIKSQEEGDIMYVHPILVNTYHDASVTNLSFTIVNIRGVGNKLAASGYGNFPIQVEFSEDSDDYILNNISFINITSSNYESWQLFMNRTLIDNGLIYSSNFTIHPVGNTLHIEIKDNHIVNILIKKIEIDAQIAPGWIEN